MANRLQLKRGEGVPGSIFYEGEPIFDKTGKTLYVGDNGGTGTGTGVAIASSDTYLASLEMLYKASESASGAIRLYEDVVNGDNYVSVAAASSLGANYTLVLPDGTGSNGQILQTDGEGILSWVNPSSGFNSFSITDGISTSQITNGNSITFVSGEGISAAVTEGGDEITISVSVASTDTQGIARFDNNYFTVVDGDVTVSSGIVTSISGTANEVEVTNNNNGTYTIGLPNDVTIGNDLTVNGNLRVVGTAVTFETEVVRVEDRIIELGLVNGTTDTSTTWDLGIAFNYGSDDTAKKSGVFWIDNTIIGIASAITIADVGVGDTTPQVTINTYAPVAAGALYIGGITSNELVINSSREAVNLVFDGGVY
jgi:hypothetical protein